MADQYIVSARKYRPDSFETLIGQDNIAQTLKNSIVRGQLAHAYLFCGPRGVGKTSMARIFAKTINCSNPSAEMEPCGECESCLSFKEGRSYCIHELDAASNNGVDDIKTLMDKVQIPPQTGRYSVYIIDEVHMLSQSAFNAFLKTLEEPPAHAIFILCTTEKHKIIPTILSRCQVYDFNRISIGGIISNLTAIAQKEGVSIDDRSLHIIAQKADGAMRDALTIFDQTVAFCGQDIKYEDVIRNLNVLDSEYGFRLVDAFLKADYATALLLFDEVLAKGFNSLYFVTSLSAHLRDLLVSATGGLEALLDVPESLRPRYREQAARCGVRFLYDALGVTTACEAGYRASASQRLHIEYALMKLSFLVGAPAPVVAQVPAPSSPAPAQPAPAPTPAQPAPAPAPTPAPAAVSATKQGEFVAKPVQIDDSATKQGEFVAKSAQIDNSATKQGEFVAKSAPAASPAPSPAPAPAQPAPAPKRASISLAALKKQQESAAAKTEAPEDKPLDDETIRAGWKALAGQYASAGRLKSAMENCELQIREEDGTKIVGFPVVSEAQKTWMESRSLAMEAAFRKQLGSQKVKLEIVLLQPTEEQEEKVYMPHDKAEKMIQANPEIKELVAELKLDI